ncbi:rifin, partial [Plasmodium falciparum RAJ116]
MKLHYYKILLFFLSLIILAYNKNKSYSTIHTPNTTSRVLIECNVYIPNYDNDPDMNSVKENFHKQTEQRFHEYDKRMIKNRQKYKEKCDKEIQKIIVKDKIEKSLAERVEKGCLKCGCGLGGVAAGVGIFGAIAVNEVKKAALVSAAQKGIEVGMAKAIDELGKIVELREFNLINWDAMVTSTTYNKPMDLVKIVSNAYYKCKESTVAEETRFCLATKAWDEQSSTLALETITQEAAKAAGAAREAAQTVEKLIITLANAE